jgi:hypothetical protein
MISTAPLAMLVIDGGVTRVRLRMVGWIENGLTPLPVSSNPKDSSKSSVTLVTTEREC